MAKPPAFQWYPKDAETDENVRMMDDAEFGFYVRCLNHAWINDGLPEEVENIARVLQRPEKVVRKYWTIVGKCFHSVNGRLRNPRLEEQRRQADEYRAEKSRAANARWGKSADAKPMQKPCTTDAGAMHVHMQMQCSASASASTNTPPTPVSATEADFAFLEWTWEQWKKQRKGQARDVVFRLVLGSDTFNWQRFRERAPLMVAHFAGMNPPWKFADLTLWDWIEGGMILPPAADDEDHEKLDYRNQPWRPDPV